MPGYAYSPKNVPMVTSTYGGENNGTNGYPSINDVSSVVFYGLKLDPLDGGRLSVEIFSDQSDGAIKLPTAGLNRYDDYKEWVWTGSGLTFSWDDSDNDHLYMEVK
jgi:hypothetical protein